MEKKLKAQQRGKNLSDVQEMNRSLVLRLLKKQGVSSRAALARLSGLNQATITNIIGDFLKWGLVKETGLMNEKKGRRSIAIEINREEYYVVGVRLARTQFTIGLFDMFGEPVQKKVVPHAQNNPHTVMENMKREIAAMIAGESGKKIVGIGIAVPGPYFRLEGRIKAITGFDGWDDIPFKEEMTGAFDIPVIIDHDANAGALAEWWVVPNKMMQGTAVYLAIEDGVGAGIINDGRVFRGGLGIAGEVGHMSIDKNGEPCECGNRGCLAKYGSTTYFMQTAKRLRPEYPDTSLPGEFDFELLVQAAKDGDSLALRAFMELAENLAVGLINIMWAYGANEIIIGNAGAKLGDLLLDTLSGLIEERTSGMLGGHVRLRITSLKEDPIFIGSAAIAIDYCLGKTSIFENGQADA